MPLSVILFLALCVAAFVIGIPFAMYDGYLHSKENPERYKNSWD